MSQLYDLKIPATPPCWEDCGSCATGVLTVQELLITPGQRVNFGDVLLVLETNKVGLDIPSLKAGRIVEVLVQEGSGVQVGDVFARLQEDS